MPGFIDRIRRADPDKTARLAQRAFRAKDWLEAARHYEEILNRRPDDAGAWVQYGHTLKESGDRSSAEAAYRRSLSLDPDLADTHLQLGHVLKLQGKLDEAAAAYVQALTLSPTMRNAAIELRSLGWDPGRIARVQRAARHAPPVPAARRIVFDISDLVQYFQRTRTPTGIQRVQISVIFNALQHPDLGEELVIACFTERRDYWIEMPRHLFVELAALSASGGALDDPVWQDALVELEGVLSNGAIINFFEGDTLVNLGTSWWLQNYFLMVRFAKATYGIRYVPFVHDLIPVMTPEHCVEGLTQDFISWIIGVFFHADGYLVNSQATAADLQRVAQRLGHTIGKPHVVRFDARFDFTALAARDVGWAARGGAAIDTPQDPFVLFVSTIESRKNHILAFNVWLELLKKRGEKATPTLVCVGNEGWLVETAMARLKASDQLQRKVRIIRKISDADLARLYRDCLFTIYPSLYEGWGLPVTEALCFGKIVVTTTVSSLPEAGGEFAEYFDVQSPRDMLAKVERLIDDNRYRREREAKINAEFKSRSWADIAEEIVRHAVGTEDRPPAIAAGRDLWVLPLPADRNRYYSLARNAETRVWRGMIGGEMFRMGTGWWQPDNWGTWTKPGLARLAFRPLPDEAPQILYLGLLGPPLVKTRYRVRFLGGEAGERKGELSPDEIRWLVITIPGQVLPQGLIHLGIEAEGTADLGEVTEGGDRRAVSVGVKGFYLCREDDLFARLRFLEALQTNNLEELNGRPDEPVDTSAPAAPRVIDGDADRIPRRDDR